MSVEGPVETTPYSSDELFAAVETVLVLFPTPLCMLYFGTSSDGDLVIHHLATRRAEAYRNAGA